MLTFLKRLAAAVPTPATNKVTVFVEDATGEPSYKDDTGTVTSLKGAPGEGVPAGGTAGQVLAKIDGADFNTQWTTPSAGAPAGADKQIQFNNAGAFGAEAGFEYNASTNKLTVSNITTSGLLNAAASATGGAGFRLPHGAAPTSPVNGDVWTTSAGGMYVRINGVTVGPLAASGGGGLTGFTASLETASPNNTVNASVIIPSGGTANQDGVYGAKGSGALQAQKADGTATGGNKRGVSAVDWQKQRLAASQVASGDNSFIGGGSNNTASGVNSCVPFGSNCIADALYSWAYGYGAQTMDRIAYDAHSAGAIFGGGLEGEAQQGRMVLIAVTTNATQTTLTSDGAAAANTNQVSMTLRSRACVVKGTIQAFQKTTDDVSAWEFTAFIKRPFSGSAAMVVACTPTLIGRSSGAAAWAVAVDADTTNNALRVRVTGEASKTIRWVCSIYDVNEIGFF